ncbi:TPA: endonuclease III domain-containing protein [Staphylococcus aureus]|uniref:endonuclease III domain-containing protein n=1 Tax=Staphylococcus aureus TaxID=1280 RepID=UPI0013A6BCEF|nr:endonuclease III domain-containing protein [Staphylococcus aureus]MBH4578530.1 endonuclease III domain-containing protein [Staphylococcus aureus]MBH4585677.1 endonuclease III domain-containing protein [Staphylococcus aureus]MBH4586604.1 endonuclease III domain-containing protein [Staphylococcus aureus]MBH4589509.1 endonuclease III domain-containing protein [Staphylococcus aureus]MBH4592213.1 endonuclease III domain-containing protein [Staphylococcus aureus]
MLGTDELYKLLYRHMGPQNWWPADNDIEMMLGAILVQNTRWRNAEIALNQIKEHTHFNANHILELPIETLQSLIRPSGFYKSKSLTIKTLLTWLARHHFNYQEINERYKAELRKELLSLKGIGSETADVLLVYIFGRIEFIPDSYTRKIYNKLGYENTKSYDQLKKVVTLPNHFTNQDANEFHALLDVFGKHYFRDKDIKNYDFLEPYFKK